MKQTTSPSRSVRLFAGLCLAAALLGAGGCQNANGLAKKLDALDTLGVTHVQITGKFSDTTYDRKVEGGVMKSRLSHNNAWVPKIVVERERPAPVAVEK